MIGRSVVGYAASAALHGVLVLVVLTIPHSTPLSPLFVDLTAESVVAETPRPTALQLARGDAAPRPPSPAPARAMPAAPDAPSDAAPPRPAPPKKVTPTPPAPIEKMETSPPPPPRAEITPTPVPPPIPPPASALVVPAPDVPMPAQAHEALPPVTWPSPSTAAPAPPIASQAPTPPPPPVAGDGSSALSRGAVGPSRATANSGTAAGADGAATGAATSPVGQQVARTTPGGGGGDSGAEYGPWLGRLRDLIQGSLRYPTAARRRGVSGIVTLELTIQPNGAIGDVHVVESSSHALLDTAAVEAVRELPAQPMPPDLPRRPLRVRLPVVFQLR